MKYRTAIIGTSAAGTIRLEVVADHWSVGQAARDALWYAESRGVEAAHIIVKEEGDPAARPHLIEPKEVRVPYYGAKHAGTIATLGAGNLPEEEQARASEALQQGELPGMMGKGRILLEVDAIDPLLIEDVLPTLSTLVQIARDEKFDWLAFVEE